MQMLKPQDIVIPADVRSDNEEEYVKNYLNLTERTGRLMLFAGDQKVEHLNDDFYGSGIAKDDADPVHIFQIASRAKIGVLATQFGLIAKYGPDFPKIPYLVKLNSKTNLIPRADKDPLSTAWVDVAQVVRLKEDSGLNILGVGYTVYLGSEYEHIMLREAAQAVTAAHRHGLIAIIWSYPRGKAVPNEKDAHLVAGAAGAAAALGADFVKVNMPESKDTNPMESLKEAVAAAGKTGLVCAGGPAVDPRAFLQRLYDQIHIAGAVGNATGRNIHQKPLAEAVSFANAIHAIAVEDKTVDEAMKIYQGR